MVFARPFLQVTAEGVVGTSATSFLDIWRAGFKIGLNAGQVPNEGQITTFLTSANAAMSAYHSNTNTGAGSSCFFLGSSAAVIDVNGRYLGGGLQPTVRVLLGTPVAGGAATIHPFSTACCITLRTDIVRGPGAAGRVYWPATSRSIVSTTGALSTSLQSQMAAAAKTMFDAINTAARVMVPAGAGVVVSSAVGPGVEAPVLRVEIGARLDSQERREKNIPEAHLGADLAIAATLRQERAERVQELLEQILEDREDQNS